MSYVLRFENRVISDLQKVKDYYDNQNAHKAVSTFFHEFKAAIEKIKETPQFYGIRYKNVRCKQIKRFPHLIHYRFDKRFNVVVILAVLSSYQKNPQ